MGVNFLSDFNKKASNLWKKENFQFFKTLEVNVDKKNPISWKAKYVLNNKGSPRTELILNQKEEGFGEFQLTLDSSEVLKLELKTKELINNLELKAIIEGTDCGELNAIYQGYKNWASKFKMNLSRNNLIIEGQFSFASENVTFGTQGIMDGNDGGFIDYNVGICLDQDVNHCYSLYSSNKFKEIALSFYYQINNDAEIGTHVDIDIYKNKIEIQTGGNYQIDQNSKISYNINSKAKLALSYQHLFNNNIKGFIGTEYNLIDNIMYQGLCYKLVFGC